LIPPGVDLDWGGPNRLMNSAARSMVAGMTAKSGGYVGLGHEIGHVNVSLDCGEYSVPLTGQTGGGDELKSSIDGFGMLLRTFDGQMNETPEGERDDTIKDIDLRQKNGLLAQASFLVNEATCKRVKSFHDEYIARGAYKRYGGDFRSRRFEGGGCAIWGSDVLDVTGMLRRSQFAPIWTQSVMVGNARFRTAGGYGPYFPGSNLVFRGADGNSVLWPKGKAIETSSSPLFPGSMTLKDWTGPEDTYQLPFSIFDPNLMNKWAEKVWADAQAHGGSAESLEASWTAGTVGKAHEITTDAHCTQPQSIPFDQDNDDLFKDSDEPNSK
jgi:hypothetical protein